MATNIPPHNLGEIIDGVLALIADPQLTDDELVKLVPGPDFPTGGVIQGRVGILSAYKTGRGTIAVRGVAHVEEIRKDRQAIIVTELPYMVNKARWIETAADMVRDKKLEGISDIRDESDRTGIRVVFELKRDASDQVVLANLFKHTALQTSFSVNMLAIVDGRPVLLSLRRALQVFIDHRRDVVTRRTLFDLREARLRREIVEGLGLAVINIDRVIEIIRSSKDTDEAKERLIAERMGGLDGFLERAGRPAEEVAAASARPVRHADAAPGAGDPRHAPRPAHRPRAREARGRVQGALGSSPTTSRACSPTRSKLMGAIIDELQGDQGRVRRRAPHRDRRRRGRDPHRGADRRGGHGRHAHAPRLHQAHAASASTRRRAAAAAASPISC